MKQRTQDGNNQAGESILSKDDLRKLIHNSATPCISLYMPTHRTRQEAEQDPIRFKNLLRSVESSLKERGMKNVEVRDLVKGCEELLTDSYFWSYQADGLAVFCSPTGCATYRLPLQCEELSVVGNRFHIKPLLPMIASGERIFLLVLALRNPKLYEATRFSIKEIPLKNVPLSLEDALKYDDPERAVQFHTGTGAQGGSRSAMFHGQAVSSDSGEHKKDVLRYFQMLEKGVHQILKNESAPLVLAGVAYTIPLYREANSYPGLLEESLAENAEKESPKDLLPRIWKLLEPRMRNNRNAVANEYRQLANTGRASNEMRHIVPAAHMGRVKSLFVAVQQHAWGKYDPEHQEALVHASKQEGDEDLLDRAAAFTFLNNGSVYGLNKDEIPGGGVAAAVFRF